MRIVKTALFLLLALAILLLTTRSILLERLTVVALENIGAEAAVVQISTLGLTRAHIDLLSATFKPAAGERLPVSIHDMSLQYSLPQLLTTGKCNLVTIKKIALTRRAGKKKQAAGRVLPGQISLLGDNLRSRLPLERLQVDQLLLNGDLPPQLTGRNIRLAAAVKGTTITAGLSLQVTADSLLTVNLLSPDSLHTTADIIGRQGSSKILEAELRLKPDGVTGTTALQLKPVRQLLLPTIAIPGWPSIDGRLTGDFRLPLPLPDTAMIQANINLLDREGDRLQLRAHGNPNTGQLSLRVTGRHWEQEFLNTTLAVMRQRISGSYSFQAGLLHSFLSRYLQQPLPKGSGRVNGSLDFPLPASEDSTFTATVRAENADLAGVTVSSARLQLTGSVADQTIVLEPASRVAADGVVVGSTGIKQLSLGLAGKFRRAADRFLLDFADQQDLQLKGLTTDRLHIDDIQLQTENPLQLSVHNQTWSVSANTLHLKPLRIREGAHSYRTGPLTCTITALNNSGSGPVLAAELTTPSLVLRDQRRALSLTGLVGTVRFKANRFRAGLLFSPENIAGRLQATVNHDFNASTGTFSLRTASSFDLSREGGSLANLFTPWQFPFDLDSGRLSVKANGSWAPDEELRLTVFAAVSGGSGFYKQFLFTGLNARQELTVLPRLRSATAGSFYLQQLIGGIDIDNIQAGLTVAPSDKGALPQLHIKDFRASLFNGTISTPAIIYDLNQPDSSFTVQLKTIDLPPLIKLINMDNLQVSGRISGAIPVTVKGTEIAVDNGELHNEPPGGEIHYSPAGMNPAGITGYALKAVEHFRYNSLKSTARYLPSGQLDLDIRLQGTSPRLATDRPVHLNIHAEQNLPALLQSLRFSRGLTEELDKRLKQHYK